MAALPMVWTLGLDDTIPEVQRSFHDVGTLNRALASETPPNLLVLKDPSGVVTDVQVVVYGDHAPAAPALAWLRTDHDKAGDVLRQLAVSAHQGRLVRFETKDGRWVWLAYDAGQGGGCLGYDGRWMPLSRVEKRMMLAVAEGVLTYRDLTEVGSSATLRRIKNRLVGKIAGLGLQEPMLWLRDPDGKYARYRRHGAVEGLAHARPVPAAPTGSGEPPLQLAPRRKGRGASVIYTEIRRWLLDAAREVDLGQRAVVPIDVSVMVGKGLTEHAFQAVWPELSDKAKRAFEPRLLTYDPYGVGMQRRRSLEILAKRDTPADKALMHGAARAVREVTDKQQQLLKVLGGFGKFQARWLDLQPTHFLVRVGDHVAYHPYLWGLTGGSTEAIFATVDHPFLGQLVEDFERVWTWTGSDSTEHLHLRTNPLAYPAHPPAVPRVVSIDLDLTLVGGKDGNGQRGMIDTVATYLRELSRAGVRRVATTGRGREFVQGLERSGFHGCFDAFVCENGHVVVRTPDASDQAVYTSKRADALAELALAVRREGWRVKSAKEQIVTVYVTRRQARALHELLDTHGLGCIADDPPDFDDEPFKHDCGDPDVSKWVGLQTLLRSWRIGAGEVLHIGDGNNDADLLRRVGFKGLIPLSTHHGVVRERVFSSGLVTLRAERPPNMFEARYPATLGTYDVLMKVFGAHPPDAPPV